MSNAKTKSKNSRTKRIASDVDRYDLYLRSVQSPENEVDFFIERYEDEFGNEPSLLREDFCGTFGVCCDWVKRGGDKFAIGVDLDPEPLAWGTKHLLSQCSKKQQERIKLLEDDVRLITPQKADVLAAQNFSFWIFKTREEVVDYFKAALKNMNDQGLFVLDMMGGGESMLEDHTDEREIDEAPIIPGNPKKFTYLWEQARFDPITHDASFYIHFQFSDRSKLSRAFEYHWRFWTLPEVRELLVEAGFRKVDVYWDVSDEDEDDMFEKRESAPSDAAWVCYVVAIK